MTTIKSCPFCGGQIVDIARTNENACWVECVTCGAQTSSRRAREGAIRLWNRRCTNDGVSVIDIDGDAEFRARTKATPEDGATRE